VRKQEFRRVEVDGTNDHHDNKTVHDAFTGEYDGKNQDSRPNHGVDGAQDGLSGTVGFVYKGLTVVF